jgi:hypothetical protein
VRWFSWRGKVLQVIEESQVVGRFLRGLFYSLGGGGEQVGYDLAGGDKDCAFTFGAFAFSARSVFGHFEFLTAICTVELNHDFSDTDTQGRTYFLPLRHEDTKNCMPMYVGIRRSNKQRRRETELLQKKTALFSRQCNCAGIVDDIFGQRFIL